MHVLGVLSFVHRAQIKRAGFLIGRQSMQRGHKKSGNRLQWDSYAKEWDKMGLRHNATGIQRVWDTMGLEHRVTGTKMGARNDGTGT